jgi:hypothetical protein
MLKSRVGNILVKSPALRINLNLDGAPIPSKSHTHQQCTVYMMLLQNTAITDQNMRINILESSGLTKPEKLIVDEEYRQVSLRHL